MLHKISNSGVIVQVLARIILINQENHAGFVDGISNQVYSHEFEIFYDIVAHFTIVHLSNTMPTWIIDFSCFVTYRTFFLAYQSI